MNRKIKKAIKIIQDVYNDSESPWIMGFSGGKDSSALLKIVFQAIKLVKIRHKDINIVYCDTGVEIPVVNDFVRKTLINLEKEANHEGIPIRVFVSQPNLEDRYFVKVIGRGYPSPTNKFRWCTDKLRIDPVQAIIKNLTNEEAIVLLGLRNGESLERDRTLSSFRTRDTYFLKQSSKEKTTIFAPIIDFDLKDVWLTLRDLEIPASIDFHKLFDLYQDSSGECPIIRSSNDIPCGKGRFGCWTCTVVRHDKSTENLIRRGEESLIPLFGFRNWLAKVRDDPEYRCKKRRNNAPGPGPFTLKARKKLLECLLMAEKQTKWKLISDDEITMIKKLWNIDYQNPKYLDIE